MTEFVEQGHLGGYIPGGDSATWYPDLWRWLAEIEGVKSVVDIGCGDGQALDYFIDELGVDVLGIEGTFQSKLGIQQWDFTKGPYNPPERDLFSHLYDFDLVWCCEFVEHVEEKYIANYLDAFKWGKILLMTHAFPGQGGYHHVNCQPPQYWQGVMAGVGFYWDEGLTMKSRELASVNRDPYNHYARSGLAFRKY